MARGRSYTIADIALYTYKHTAKDGGFELAIYSGIRDWLGRVRAQPGHIPQVQEEQDVPVVNWPGYLLAGYSWETTRQRLAPGA